MCLSKTLMSTYVIFIFFLNACLEVSHQRIWIQHDKLLQALFLCLSSRGKHGWEKLLQNCAKGRWMKWSRWSSAWLFCAKKEVKGRGVERKIGKMMMRTVSGKRPLRCCPSCVRIWTMPEVINGIRAEGTLKTACVHCTLTASCPLQTWWPLVGWSCASPSILIMLKVGWGGVLPSSLPPVPRTCHSCSSTCLASGRCRSFCSWQILTQTPPSGWKLFTLSHVSRAIMHACFKTELHDNKPATNCCTSVISHTWSRTSDCPCDSLRILVRSTVGSHSWCFRWTGYSTAIFSGQPPNCIACVYDIVISHVSCQFNFKPKLSVAFFFSAKWHMAPSFCPSSVLHNPQQNCVLS